MHFYTTSLPSSRKLTPPILISQLTSYWGHSLHHTPHIFLLFFTQISSHFYRFLSKYLLIYTSWIPFFFKIRIFWCLQFSYISQNRPLCCCLHFIKYFHFTDRLLPISELILSLIFSACRLNYIRVCLLSV